MVGHIFPGVLVISRDRMHLDLGDCQQALWGCGPCRLQPHGCLLRMHGKLQGPDIRMAREVAQGEHVDGLDVGDQGTGLKSQLPGSLHHGIQATFVLLSP